LVHRLDRDTSGALLLARHRQAAIKLQELLKDHKNNSLTKIYWALLSGVPKVPRGRINIPLEKVQGKRGEDTIVARDQVTKTAKFASTDFQVVEELDACAFVTLSPTTGRTHQLRVHCASALECPILGDPKYGLEKDSSDKIKELIEVPANKLFLHARRIVFKHPFTGKIVNVAAALPEHMKNAWTALGLNENYKEKLADFVLKAEASPQKETPKKSYGKPNNQRRSIWKPKVHPNPKKLPKQQKKKRPPRSMRKKSAKDGGAEDDKKGKKLSRKGMLDAQRYRSMRRVRPVRKLAPKIRR